MKDKMRRLTSAVMPFGIKIMIIDSPESRRLDHAHLYGQAVAGRHEAFSEGARTTDVLKNRVVASSWNLVLAISGKEGRVVCGTRDNLRSRFSESLYVPLTFLLAK